MSSNTNGGADRPETVSRAEIVAPDGALVIDSEFQDAFGEKLSQTLDLDTWDAGGQLAEVFDRLDQEVADALEREDQIRKAVREVVFPDDNVAAQCAERGGRVPSDDGATKIDTSACHF
jgi:hypothetical protein